MHETVSVIMPVRNEGAFIERSLGAVLSQDYPSDLVEVLIIDGMSEDDTRERVRFVAESSPISIRIIDNPGLIAPCALNLGIEQARGDIVARVDGHCIVPPEFLALAVSELRDREVGCVGGAWETIGQGMVSEAIASAMTSPFGVGNVAFRVGGIDSSEPIEVDTVPFPVFRRETLVSMGPFDEDLVRNQDDEYSSRLRRNGFRILLVPGMTSRYYCRSSPWRLAKQYFQYGLYKVRVLQKHPLQMKARHFVPALFVIALFALGLLSPLSPLPFLVLIGVYSLASVAAALRISRGGAAMALPIVCLSFLLLHLGYGLGFMAGLLFFAGRWGDQTSRPESWRATEVGGR